MCSLAFQGTSGAAPASPSSLPSPLHPPEISFVSHAYGLSCAGAGSRPLGGQATRGTLGARASIPGLPPLSLSLPASTGRSRLSLVVAASAKRDKMTTLSVVTYIDKRMDQLRGESTAAKGETTAAILQLSQKIDQLGEKLDKKIDMLRVETTAAIVELSVRQRGLESSVDASRTTTVSLFGVVSVIVALLMYFRPS